MNQELAALDRALARRGETIILRRPSPSNPSAVVDVKLKAIVRGYRPQELVGGLTMTDSKVILSPTYIKRAQWPGGQTPLVPPFDRDPSIPRPGDRVIIQGKIRTVQVVGPIYVGGELVRIEMQVLG